jgi:hypothetical protein
MNPVCNMQDLHVGKFQERYRFIAAITQIPAAIQAPDPGYSQNYRTMTVSRELTLFIAMV